MNREKITNWLKENIDKYNSKKDAYTAAADFFEIESYRSVESMWRTYMDGEQKAERKEKKKVFLTEGDISERHDSYYKIRMAAKSLKKGEYVEDGDFRDVIVGMSANEFRRPSDNPEFDVYKGRAGGKTYWGNPESIKDKKTEGIFK